MLALNTIISAPFFSRVIRDVVKASAGIYQLIRVRFARSVPDKTEVSSHYFYPSLDKVFENFVFVAGVNGIKANLIKQGQFIKN